MTTIQPDEAREALAQLLWELPAEFSDLRIDPDSPSHTPREQFHVIKGSNVRKVHRSLRALQQYFGMDEQ